jgi:hypothetical protein
MKNSLIILALLFSGCARHAPPATAPPAQSIAKKSYVIPFERTESGLMTVSVIININTDHPDFRPLPKRLVVDTGCARTCFFVSNKAVSDLSKILPHAKLDERRMANGSGMRVCTFDPARVTVGDVSVDIPVDASGYDIRLDMPFDGCLGIDFLSRFNVQFDFHAKTMALTER